MKYDIFVSYRRTDQAFVEQVVARLRARNVGVWYDGDIPKGEDWRGAIVEALESSDMLVLVFSEAANDSRQMIKELDIADRRAMPVVPVLIENTRFRGAYLYELGSRNYIEFFPDAEKRVDDLVDHLAALAHKTPDGLSGHAANPVAVDETGTESAQIDARPAEPAAAPTRSDAYVGKTFARGRTIPRQDILPFRWIDLAVLAPVLGALTWWLANEPATDFFTRGALRAGFLVALAWMMVIGVFAALVFPFRYYFRRRRVVVALWKYLVSAGLLFSLLIGIYLLGRQLGAYPHSRILEVIPVFAAVWLGFTAIAFALYGVLNAQRALRSLRANRRKL